MDPTQARARIRCSVSQIDAILPDALREAEAVMSAAGIEAWFDGASTICGLGRGTELPVIFLEGMPEVVRATDETVIAEVADTAVYLSGALCAKALNPFLATPPVLARRLESADSLRLWLRLVRRMAKEAADGLVPLLAMVPGLSQQLAIGGLANWIDFGIRAYREQPYRYPEFFLLQTADAHAALQRERHGTLYADNQRSLTLYLHAFWGIDVPLKPYSLAFDALRKPVPHIDKLGLHIPDVVDDLGEVPGIDRYRAMLAHMVAHKRFSRPYLADNYSPFQHLVIETFEDARVEALAMRTYPGLRRLWLRQHPMPVDGAVPEGFSPIRHKLAMLSRALLDPGHGYADPLLLEAVARFRAGMAERAEDPMLSAELGVWYLTKLHTPAFHSPKVWFEDTIVTYRDDNRWLWMFLEDVKNEDQFHSDHGTPDPVEQEGPVVLPRHYPEWDYQSRAYRPDWATVFEATAAAGDAAAIDRVLERHALLAKQIKRLIDRLKPQLRKRLRHQMDGDEFDLDHLIGNWIDLQAGSQPDGRVYQTHQTDGRDIAVMLLLDLSESIRKAPPGLDVPLLQLEQEAVTLLAWAVEALGDPFAIAGFSSDTRHEVRYQHYKGFNEPWGAEPKARLAAMAAGGSTRMGAALRHAGEALAQRREDKKLLLLLSDGEPSDVDVDDADYLKWDTHAAVAELRARGVSTFCMTLDSKADAYVADIFGPSGYTVVDQVGRLPERLSRLFMSLTR